MLLLFSAAHAFDVQEVASAPLAYTATRLVPLERASGLYVAVVGHDTVEVLEREGRSTVATLGRGARDVVERDADADGLPELWVCDDDGVWRIPWPEADTFGEPVQVLTEPCAGLAPIWEGLVVVGADLVRWSNDGAGGLEDGGAISAAPAPLLLASDGATAIVAGAGGATVTIVRDTGHEEVDATGLVGGVTLFDGAPAWSLADGATVMLEERVTFPVAEGPGALATADLDGDGDDDLAVLHAGQLGVVRAGLGTEDLFPIDWTTVVGVRGHTCGALWGLDADGTTLLVAENVDCDAERDGDEDGYTPATGDCDDADASTWPGAPPGCDGADHDCDGVAEWEPGDWLPAGLAVLEGSRLALPYTSECFDDATVTWTLPEDERIVCDVYTRQLWCEGLDDAVGTLTAAVFDAEGALLDHRESTLTVVNANPRFDPDDFGSFGFMEVSATVDVPLSETIRVEDAGGDLVTFELLDGPSGMTLSETGRVEWTPTNDHVGRVFTPTVVLRDDDGGHAERTYRITVVDPDSGGSLCCSGAALLLVLLAPRARRSRR